MKPNQIIKIVIDILMTAMLLLLMAYSLVGEAIHEWLGIVLSRHALSFLPITGGRLWARTLHMLILGICFYLSSHWPSLEHNDGHSQKNVGEPSAIRSWIVRAVELLLDYISIMALFVFVGHYLAEAFRLIKKK